MTRVLLCGGLTVSLAFGSGCGGTSDDEIAKAREEGRQAERLKQQERRTAALERQLETEKNRRRRGSSGASGDSSSRATPSVANAGPSAQSGDGRSSCGDELSVGPNTTCVFARAVRSAYSSEGAGTYPVYSAVTQRAYTMTCSGGSPHVCTGGNNASVYFP